MEYATDSGSQQVASIEGARLMRRTAIISDLQVPYHHRKAVQTLAKFIRETEPDDVLCVGDVLDAPQISRWTRGQPGEFTADLGKHRDKAVAILEELGVKHLSRSNHDDRIELYIEQKAQGLLGLKELTTPGFLKLDEIGCKFHRQPYEFLPNWYLMHGDEGGLHSNAGMTGLNLARKVGANVVIGHTHRLGITHDSDSISGKLIRTKVGFETGCLMDLSQAEYIKKQAGSANWQLGFGMIYSDATHVQAVPVAINPDGSFICEGRLWR